MKKLVCIIALLCVVLSNADAQDLKSILSGIAQQVVGDKATTATSIWGTWTYVKPDCQFKGDNLFTNAGGEMGAVKVQEKMEGGMNKRGIKNIQFSFNYK